MRIASYCRSLVCLCLLLGSAVFASEPNDPDFPLQWGLLNTGQLVEGQSGVSGADVHAPAAWEIHAGTPSVIVAIVGRGIDPHPEFGDRLLEGYSIVGDPFDTLDYCPHDTHLAGIVAAATNNGVGIAGVCEQAWLLPVRVFEGCGVTEADADTAGGIIWAVDHGADIVLVPVQFPEGTQELAEAVEYAVANDVLVIAPAGSVGSSEVSFPAAFDGCLAVAATTNQDTISSDSSYGPEVDLAAPGRGIWSTWVDGGYAYQPSGRDTASASAFVTGIAALVRSYAPQLTAPEIAQVLIESADDRGEPGWDPHFGAGRVNAAGALESTPLPMLRFEHIESLPTVIPPDVGSSFRVRIAEGTERLPEDQASLFYRVDGGDFGIEFLHHATGDIFTVELPAVSCGSAFEFFLMAVGDDGGVVTDPLRAADELYAAGVAYVDVLIEDDFEDDLGWEVEGGDNTSGLWSRVEPVGTSAQPGYDRSPNEGRYCYVTGQHFGGHDGSNDVDEELVQLTSPVIDLGTAGDAEIRYARWFHCSGSGEEDFLTVEVSRDGGSMWATAETVASTDAWVTHSFLLSEFPELTGSLLRVRFSTQDDQSDSLTEAAIDEFRVRAFRCSITPGDANHDGVIDLTDAARMLDCWRGPEHTMPDETCGTLDFDHDYRIDLRDFQAFQLAIGPS